MKFTFPPESKPLAGFTIKRAVHRGGFGEVYYALTDAGKEVALKLLNQHTDVELRGATACLNLNHPHLVTIYDIKSDADGDHWVVMEYVGGKRLCDVLEDRRTLPVEEIERWLDGMASGLTFLHERGIVHRDLKPSNVFSENGVVKVGDVGLSKFISESRKSAHTQSVGTVYYMAPEVARGRYGREVDVYALGIILFEMLTGEVPFDGESTGEILMKHLSSPPPLDKIPSRIRPVLAKALEKDPHRRTPTVNQLRDEFKAAVRGRSFANDEPQEIPEHAFLDRRAGEYARSYSHEQRRAAARGYADGARRAGVKNPCGPRAGCGRRVSHAYADANRHWPGQKPGEKNWTPVIVIGAVAAFLMFTRAGHHMMPSIWEGAILAALAWGVYSAVKWMTPTAAPVRVPVNQGAPAVSMPVAAPNVQSPPLAGGGLYGPRMQPVAQVRRPAVPTPDTPRTIAYRERASQFSGSMTVAALAAAIITGTLAALGFVDDLPSTLLFGGTAVLGSWAMLGASKAIEGTALPGITRRLWQGAAGVTVGGMAWGLDQFLLADLTGGDGRYYGLVTHVGDVSLTSQGEPAAIAYMAFFGLLFALRRWWWQADAYRPKRLKVSSALLTALLGYVLTTILYFPHAWGIVWAIVISCVVQLAAAWAPPGDRRAAAAEQPAA
ncbi:MAG: serine/threonine-protein kinase [Planctomycetaceae bacterium]